MAGYNYNYRSGYSTGQGAPPYTDQWGQTRYANAAVDDECRTVIVDADGTRRTIIGCTPLNKPGSYVTNFGTSINERVEPVRNYGYAADNTWRRPSSPPRQVFDDQSRVGVGPYDGVNWRQQPNQTGYNGTAGYGDYSNNTLYRPNGNNIRNDNYDDHYNRKQARDNYDDHYNRKQAKDNYDDRYNRKHDGGHKGKASRSTWSTSSAPPVRGDGRLSIPTDDMEKALHYLKESAKPSAWPR